MNRIPKYILNKLPLGGDNIMGEGNPFAWQTSENYQHPKNPASSIAYLIPEDNRNPNNISSPVTYPSVGEKFNAGVLADPINLSNVLLRGISEGYNNNRQSQYFQNNVANPLASLPFNNQASEGVRYGYEQFNKGGILEKYDEGGVNPPSNLSPSNKSMGTDRSYDSIPSYLYYVKATQDGNEEGQKLAISHIAGYNGQQMATDLQFLGKNLKNSSLNDLARRGIDKEKNPEMRKLFAMVNENPDIINNFDFALPERSLASRDKGGKFALGGSAYRSKVLSYLYDDDEEESTPKAVTENTAPTTEEVPQSTPLSNDQDDLIAMALSEGMEERNPYREIKNNYKGIKTKSPSVNISNLNPDLGNILNQTFQSFPGLAVTSGNDSKHTSGSTHYDNEAVDIGANSSNPLDYKRFKEMLPSLSKQLGFRFIDEKDHIHISKSSKGKLKYGGKKS